MPRPNLPKPDEIASIAKALKDEGFVSGRVEASPDGSYVIAWGTDGKAADVTHLEEWRARRGAS